MTYNELRKIAHPYIKNISSVPANSFMLAKELGIPVNPKENIKGKLWDELKGICDVTAFMTVDGDRKTIYFSPNTRYWNFYIFHEIAHFILGHTNDGTQEELDANMLACILLAPVENLPTYLRTARDLSCLANIPIDKAEEYWEEIYMDVRHNYISDVANDYLMEVHSAVDRLLNRVEILIGQVH